MTTIVQQKGLAAKIAEVILEVTNVEKDGHNDFQNYDYTSAEALLGVIRKPLASRGVVVFPKLGAIEERGAVSPKGKQTTVTTAHVTYVFVDTETGEREECPWAGSGDDPSDKGLYKAYTGAAKTFLRQAFLLPMGDDPEADTEADKRAAQGASSEGRGSKAGAKSQEKSSEEPSTGPRTLGDLSDAELEAATGGKVILDTAAVADLKQTALDAGVSERSWKARLAAEGVKEDTITLEVANKLSERIAEAAKKNGK